MFSNHTTPFDRVRLYRLQLPSGGDYVIFDGGEIGFSVIDVRTGCNRSVFRGYHLSFVATPAFQVMVNETCCETPMPPVRIIRT